MNLKSTALVLAALMSIASLAAVAARPSAKASDYGRSIVLKDAVPNAFTEWVEVPEQTSQVVNPQIAQALDKLYSQLLTRTYVNQQGYRIMLSIAYGDDQRGGLQAHRPETCYPGQGFKIAAIEDGALQTRFGNIEVRRMTTNLGARHEPVTYWLTVGEQVVNSRLLKRIAEVRLALTGQVPDGLLFRVSSIDADPVRAFAAQEKFAADMMSSVPEKVRKQLSGLLGQANAS